MLTRKILVECAQLETSLYPILMAGRSWSLLQKAEPCPLLTPCRCREFWHLIVHTPDYGDGNDCPPSASPAVLTKYWLVVTNGSDGE